ncbi:MAG: glycosyltransferase family 4 protein [Polyangia bacterium]
MSSVLVSHPHAAPFATGAAAGLARSGHLATYVTGIAAIPGRPAATLARGIGEMLPIARNRLVDGLSPKDLLSLGAIELSSRFLSKLAKAMGLAGPSPYDAMFVAHDAAVSLLPWPKRTDVVYAYEDAALLTFERAGRRGLERIWHLPIPHYATLERMWLQESDRWPGAMGERPPVEPEWKKRRKDAEFRLADRISVPSEYTAASLHAAGARVPVIVTPFGFPVDEFPRKDSYSDGPFTVIAVGTQDLRKGTPYLLEAWRKAGIKNARLKLIGPMSLTKRFVDRYAGIFEHVAHVPRTRLQLEYRAADLLVLPTLGDGCPLVVQEAMCSGTPVITTPCGNGPDFITTGHDGWVIPERDIDALVDHLRIAAADRDRTLEIGRAARRRAERWTWTDVGHALTAAIDGRTRY